MAYKFLVFFLTFFTLKVYAIERQRSMAKEFPFLAAAENYVKNPSCIKNIADITDAGGALSRNTSNSLTQEADCQLDNTVANAVKWEVDTLPNILDGQNCEGRVSYTGTASDVWALEFEVDGTDVIQDLDLVNTASGKTNTVAFNYPCPVGSTIFMEIDGQGGPAGNTNVAGVYFGPETNIGSAETNPVYVAASVTGAQSVPTSTLVRPNYVASLNKGGAWDDSAKEFACPDDDIYYVEARISYSANSAGNRDVRILKNAAIIYYEVQTAESVGPTPLTVSGLIDCSVGDIIHIETAQASGGNLGFPTDSRQNTLSIIKASEEVSEVFKVGAPGQDLTEYTANPSTGSFNGSATRYEGYQCGDNGIKVQIVGSQSSSGANGSGTYFFSLPTNYEFASEYPDGATVGHGYLFNGTDRAQCTALKAGASTNQFFLSCVYDAGEGAWGSSFFGLSNAALEWGIVIDANVTAGSPCPRTAMPLLKNAVTTSSAGVERIERAKLTLSGTSNPVITSQSGDWLTSCVRSGVGNYNCTITSGKFSADPSCSIIGNNTAPNQFRMGAGTTSFNFIASNGAVVQDINEVVMIMCMGPN